MQDPDVNKCRKKLVSDHVCWPYFVVHLDEHRRFRYRKKKKKNGVQYSTFKIWFKIGADLKGMRELRRV